MSRQHQKACEVCLCEMSPEYWLSTSIQKSKKIKTIQRVTDARHQKTGKNLHFEDIQSWLLHNALSSGGANVREGRKESAWYLHLKFRFEWILSQVKLGD